MTLLGLLFDKDGTLFDFQRSWGDWTSGFLDDLAQGETARAAALAKAIGFDAAARRFLPESPIIAGTVEEGAALMLPYLPGMQLGTLVDRMNASTATVSMSEAVPLGSLLDRLLGAGLRLGVATNDGEAPAWAQLVAAGVEAHFEFVAGYDSGFGGKPAPGQLLAFADLTGIRPEAVAMVGDSTHDLLAGRAAGMVTVGVLTGVAPHSELAPLADVVLPDIGCLPDWIAESGRARAV